MCVTRQAAFLGTFIGVWAFLSPTTSASIPDRPPTDRQPASLSKPRISPLAEAEWQPVHKELIAKVSPKRRVGNQLGTLLRIPRIVEGAMPFTNYLTDDSSLTPRHRHILILRTAWLCGSQAIWSSQATRARSEGMTAEEIRGLAAGPDAPGLDPFERTLLQAADQLYINSSINDATWKALASQYDMFHLMDAVETVNHFTFLALLFNSLGVQPDEGTTERLPRDVPYRIRVPEPEPALKVARVEPNPGTGIAVGRTFAKHARMNQSRGGRAGYINRVMTLSPRDREILILRIGWDCRSEYEWAQHVGSVGRARSHGADPVQIARGPDAPGTHPFDAALLRAADELYRDAIVSNRTWNELSGRFNTADLMSVVFTVGSYRATSMSLRAYGVQLEPSDERFPDLTK
jgi:alkylhydroperoxidase family enzyme